MSARMLCNQRRGAGKTGRDILLHATLPDRLRLRSPDRWDDFPARARGGRRSGEYLLWNRMLPVLLTANRPLDVLVADRRLWLAFLGRRLPTGVDADDVLQDALLKAANSLTSLRDESHLKAWFFRILRNAVADAHARKSAVPVADEPLADLDGAPIDASPFTCGCDATLAERLDPAQRELIHRVYRDGLPVQTVAKELGITANLASVRLHRARATLRTAIEDLCGATTYAEARDCGCESEGCTAG